MLNEATLIGRIGKKDSKTLNNGTEIATLSVATSKKWINPQGQQEEQTTWHNVSFFNKLADVVKRHAHVGNLIYVKGEINHKKIEQGNNQDKWVYSITGKEIKLLPGGKKEDKIQDKTEQINELNDNEIPF